MTAAHESDDAPALRDRVAEEVRALLARRRMSGAQLARELGKSQTFIARRLDGRQAMDIDDLEGIARVLGVPVSAFFVASDVPFLSLAPQANSRALTPTHARSTERYQAENVATVIAFPQVNAGPKHAATAVPPVGRSQPSESRRTA